MRQALISATVLAALAGLPGGLVGAQSTDGDQAAPLTPGGQFPPTRRPARAEPTPDASTTPARESGIEESALPALGPPPGDDADGDAVAREDPGDTPADLPPFDQLPDPEAPLPPFDQTPDPDLPDTAATEPGATDQDPATAADGEADPEDEAGEGRFIRAPLGVIEPERPVPLPAVETVAAPGAVLRHLDKLSGRNETVTVAAGERRRVGRLDVFLEECRVPQSGSSHGTIAFLQVWDTKDDAEEPVFSGWMFADSPALSAMDHPRYDLWVISCSTSSEDAAGDSAQKSP